VQLRGAARAAGYLVDQALPATDLHQADDRQRQQRGDDDEELQHLVVDGRGKAAECGVRQHDERGDDDRDPERPAEQQVHDAGEQEQVGARDQDLRCREADAVDQVGRLSEAAAHELRDTAHLGAVVERHHHDAEEQHRRDRTDPEVVHRRQAVLGAVADMPITSTAPRFAEMNASPVTHAGSERPERKKSRLLDTCLRDIRCPAPGRSRTRGARSRSGSR
jgi:hypothetical protein